MSTKEYQSRLKSTGRNDACSCGSGKKYKKCHLQEDEEKQRVETEKARKAAEEKAAKENEGAETKDLKDAAPHKPEIKSHKTAIPGVHQPRPGAVVKQITTPRKAS